MGRKGRTGADGILVVQCGRIIVYSTSRHRRRVVLQDHARESHHLWLDIHKSSVRFRRQFEEIKVTMIILNRVQPTSLTFLAYCAANSRTYPVGPATGIPGAATQLVWDPYAFVFGSSGRTAVLRSSMYGTDTNKHQAHQPSLKLRTRYEYSTNEDRPLSLLLGDSPVRMPSSSLRCILPHRTPLSLKVRHSQNLVSEIKLIDLLHRMDVRCVYFVRTVAELDPLASARNSAAGDSSDDSHRRSRRTSSLGFP